jgi:hypothetical protein
MSARTIIVDLLALAAIVVGFHLVFRQSFVRRLWGGPERPLPRKEEGEDPAHYAMIIFGMMLLAFGIILFAFTTLFETMMPG